MRIDVQVDTRSAIAALEALGKRDANAAINTALRRATRSTAAEASREVRQELNVKATALSGLDGRIIKATAPSGGAASVKVKGEGVPLSRFKGTRQTRKGLSVQILRGKTRKVLGSRFLHPLTGTSIEREKRGGRRVPRIPVRVLFGPGVAQFLSKRAVLERLKSHAITRFAIEFERELLFRLRRGEARRVSSSLSRLLG